MTRLTVPAACALALLLAGCAAGPSKPPEEAVAARAEARWQALIKHDWKTAYDYLTPGYRQAHALDTYGQRMTASRVNWTGATVRSVDCPEPERCVATLDIAFDVTGGLPGVQRMSTQSPVTETWLALDGKWYHLPRATE